MAKQQRLGRNSALTQVGVVSDAVPLPEGVVLRSDAEMVMWRQITDTRCAKDWRELDLMLVAKAVRLEADIRKHQEMLDRTGPLLKTDRGTPIPNPMIQVIETLQRSQLTIIRGLGILQTETDPRTKNAAGFAQTGFRSLIDGTDDLIAR